MHHIMRIFLMSSSSVLLRRNTPKGSFCIVGMVDSRCFVWWNRCSVFSSWPHIGQLDGGVKWEPSGGTPLINFHPKDWIAGLTFQW